MAIAITLKKEDMLKKSYVGFSWTTLFFGFLVPLFRGDILWGIIFLIFDVFTLTSVRIILCFVYNGIYTKNKLKNGFVPADSYSEGVLRAKGYIL